MKKFTLIFLALCCVGSVLIACSSIDCPLNNSVAVKYKLAGEVTTLPDTLTISAYISDDNDSVILNQAYDVDSFLLPMSYGRNEDVLFLETTDEDSHTAFDTIRIKKENHPHFEAVDCAPAYFHTITSVTTTQHAIEKIEVNQPNVTYDATQTHLLIYFKSNRH